MRIEEAKAYFRTLGSLHVGIKRSADASIPGEPTASEFLDSERKTPEYKNALNSLLLYKPLHLARLSSEEKRTVDARTRVSDLSETLKGLAVSNVKVIVRCTERSLQAIGFMRNRREVLGNLDQKDSDVLVLGAALVSREANNNILDALPVNDDKIGKLRTQIEGSLFVGLGFLDMQLAGVSLFDFYQEDFRKGKIDSKQLKKYIEFFLTFAKSEEEIIEAFSEQNQTGLRGEFHFAAIHSTLQADDCVYGLLFNEHGGYGSRVGDVDIDKDYIAKANHMLGQVRKFRGLVRSILFSENHPDAPEFQDLIIQYLSSEDSYKKGIALAMFSDAENTKETVDLYRFTASLAQTNKRYEVLSERLLDITALQGKESADDIGDIIENGGLSQDQVIPNIGDFQPAIDTIGNLFTQQSDLSSLGLPWDKIGLKPPTTFQIYFPTGSKYVFQLMLKYQEESGEAFEIVTTVDAKKKSFDWDKAEDPIQYGAYRNIFLALNGEVLAHFQRAAQERRGQPAVQPQRERLYETREKVVREKRSQNPFSAPSSGMRAERQVARPTIVDDDESVNKHLEAVDFQDHALIRQKIADLRVGKGSMKKLTDVKTPEGGQVHRARAGNYRIKFVEVKTEKPGVAIKIYNIQPRRDAYR